LKGVVDDTLVRQIQKKSNGYKDNSIGDKSMRKRIDMLWVALQVLKANHFFECACAECVLPVTSAATSSAAGVTAE
jgi:hypothetical protein